MENKETVAVAVATATKKRTRGRQKIPIEKIAKKSNLQVTFSKRRAGLFKKARELSTLSGAQVAIIVESPGGKLFSFGTPSVDSVIHRFEEDGFNSANWWEDLCLEGLGLQELEECKAALEVLKKNLLKKNQTSTDNDDLGMMDSSFGDVLEFLGINFNQNTEGNQEMDSSSFGDVLEFLGIDLNQNTEGN